MKLFADLFSTDYGMMSAAVIAFTIGMAVYFYRFYTTKMEEDEKKAGR